jgi:hypothetical protein
MLFTVDAECRTRMGFDARAGGAPRLIAPTWLSIRGGLGRGLLFFHTATDRNGRSRLRSEPITPLRVQQIDPPADGSRRRNARR